jgi:hypothetical protein
MNIMSLFSPKNQAREARMKWFACLVLAVMALSGVSSAADQNPKIRRLHDTDFLLLLKGRHR